MPELVLADVSEFQGAIDWSAYGASIPAVIVRAHNGYRADNCWAANCTGAATNCLWWAAYQYLPADVDPTVAANKFVDTLGDQRPDVVILDLEEGTGDQQPRQHAWLATVVARIAAVEWTYSGMYFARAHNLDGTQWIAAYGQSEPTDAHELWQFSDAVTFPGIPRPCDASVFHGDVTQLPGALMPLDANDLLAVQEAVSKALIAYFGDQGQILTERANQAPKLDTILTKVQTPASPTPTGAVKVTGGSLTLG